VDKHKRAPKIADIERLEVLVENENGVHVGRSK